MSPDAKHGRSEFAEHPSIPLMQSLLPHTQSEKGWYGAVGANIELDREPTEGRPRSEEFVRLKSSRLLENPRLVPSMISPITSVTGNPLQDALNIFLGDTVVYPTTDSSENGHFAGLLKLVHASSRSDYLPIALDAVALASLATRLGHVDLHIEAMRRYTLAIHRLRRSDLASNGQSPLACTILLSIYELVNASQPDETPWLRHLHGMLAVVRNKIRQNQLPATGIPALLLGLEFPGDQSSVPMPVPRFKDLCEILNAVNDLFRKSTPIFNQNATRYESTLRQRQEEARVLRSELLAWSNAQSQTRPLTIERFTQPFILRFPGTEDLVCPTTRADYFNNLCTWNSYRQCQLHLTDLLDRLNQLLSKDPEVYCVGRAHIRLSADVKSLADDVFASLPFMLIGPRIRGCKPFGALWCQKYPPMLLGGLRIQWILFTISILQSVPETTKHHANECLRWIGNNLGIGQAAVLAQMNENPLGGITAKGDRLGWAGFLV